MRATLARRDAIADDDIVGVYLDTFHDRRRAYYIFFNPYGIQADGIYTEGKPDPDLTVDLVIDSKGTIDARRLHGRSGDSVRVAALSERRVADVGTARAALHPARSQRADLLDAAVAESLEPARSGRRSSANSPTSARAARSKSSRPASSRRPARRRRGFVDGKADPEPGVTVNFGITPTMNAAFTANPDFAQVEADQLVLTVNQRFPIFYDEKRPFFLEGIDAFQTPINLIHTRTIVAPDYAVKLTGKQGRTTVGALFAADGASEDGASGSSATSGGNRRSARR